MSPISSTASSARRSWHALLSTPNFCQNASAVSAERAAGKGTCVPISEAMKEPTENAIRNTKSKYKLCTCGLVFHAQSLLPEENTCSKICKGRPFPTKPTAHRLHQSKPESQERPSEVRTVLREAPQSIKTRKISRLFAQ